MIVWNAKHFDGRDERVLWGCEPMVCYTYWWFWPTQDLYLTWPVPWDRFAAKCKEVQDRGVRAVLLQIEGWPNDIRKVSDGEVEQTMERLMEIGSQASHAAPLVEFGWYSTGTFPIVSGYKHLADQAWYDANIRLLRTRDEAGRYSAADPWRGTHFACPSLYAHHGLATPDAWIANAEPNLHVAAWIDRPVRPAISPEWHPCAGELLPIDYWRAVLAFCHDQHVQPVLWASNKTIDAARAEGAEWLDALREHTGP
uniref:Glycoside hydrolase n=1 Tax=viral metagenome TaxID=1070528 RepID=A0A6H1ZFT6_9ZZZZ